jgi:membrane fusion protein, multidrug efflux system
VRITLVILGLLAVIGGLVGVKYKQISSLINMGKAMEKSGPPPEAVATAISQEQSWEGTLSAVGSLTAARGVALSNDAPGVVSRINFESGALVRAGQVLLELDSSVERAQLASASARKDLASLTAGRSRALAESNTIAQAQVDTDDAQLKSASTDVNGIQAQLDRKLVRAPFAGRLGIRAVNLGQYLNPGTTLTVLQAIDSVYVDFALPQQRLSNVKVGMPVRVSVEGEGADGTATAGTIAAIDPVVDATTRMMKLRAAVPNKQEKLRPGMFVKVEVVLAETASDRVVAVPSTAVLHASYGDSLFVVEDKKDDAGASVKGPTGEPAKVARQQFVKLGASRGDFVAVADGLKAGQTVVSAGAFKLRNGASVTINNSVKTDPQLIPHPENH